MKRSNICAFIRMSGLSAVVIVGLILSSMVIVVAQDHDMHNMPGMKKSKPKAKVRRKTAAKKRRVATRKSRTTKKHDMSNMSGMKMSGMKMSGMHRRGTASKRGFRRSPEGQEPDVDIRRTTASLQYNKPFDRGNWASAFVWGRNHASSPGEIHNLNGYTAESTVNFLDKNYLYTRLELVDKDDLLRPADKALLGITQDHPSFRIGAYTFGGVRDTWNTDKVSLGIGSDVTFFSKPAMLDRIYGSNPMGWKLFLRIRPGKMDMTTHGMHGGMNMPSNPAAKP